MNEAQTLTLDQLYFILLLNIKINYPINLGLGFSTLTNQCFWLLTCVGLGVNEAYQRDGNNQCQGPTTLLTTSTRKCQNQRLLIYPWHMICMPVCIYIYRHTLYGMCRRQWGFSKVCRGSTACTKKSNIKCLNMCSCETFR